MKLRPILLAFAVALIVPIASRAEEPAPAAPVDPVKSSVDAVRRLGVALFAWARDNGPKVENRASAETPEADLSRAALISEAELTAMLVPSYLPSLELADGWGRPLEVRFDRTLAGTPAMSVRSSGADGRFAGDRYPVGSFDATDADSDIVWADGYFVRWPAKN